MIILSDEGFADFSDETGTGSSVVMHADSGGGSMREREELAFSLLASLPRSRLAEMQRRIAPLLTLDIVGLLPDEVALEVLSYLSYRSLLSCSLVSRRWCTLTNDRSTWKRLCIDQDWQWRVPPAVLSQQDCHDSDMEVDSDDEGWGDEEGADETSPRQLDDSGFASISMEGSSVSMFVGGLSSASRPAPLLSASLSKRRSNQYPGRAPCPGPDYKLLHQTHIRIRNRITTGTFSLSCLQTRGTAHGHANTIYCLQLYTYPDSGHEVLFTGSKDRTVREWDLRTGMVRRVIVGVHEGSVLTLCVHNGLLATGGSDRRVAVYDLHKDVVRRVIVDHTDSVLCVRFDDRRLVSCSKDRTVRTYSFPNLTLQHILPDHRAAVNAVSLSSAHIITASGDRSMRLYDARTGKLLRTFENHHGRGIASIDYKPPFVLSGSSDKHLRLVDVNDAKGWSTCPDVLDTTAGALCATCGRTMVRKPDASVRSHEDLVRSVAMGTDFVVSGSYDFTVKVWDRKTGALVADLAGGHTGRIFCVGFNSAKVISCGEDQRICIWDFAHGFDTSFLKL